MNGLIKELIDKNVPFTVDGRVIELRKKYTERGVPTLLAESLNELLLFINLKQPKKILEFGTSVGCSGIAMLTAAKDAELYTIEKYDVSYAEAKENFEAFGYIGRVKQFFGEATEVVDKVGDGFDFVFLDCNKSKYKILLPKIKAIMNSGAILFADNVLFRGYVMGEVKAPHRHNTIKNNMREFLRLICEDGDFITTVSDIGDGISVSYKK